MNTAASTHSHTHMHIYIYTYMQTYLHIYICMYMRIYIYTYVYVGFPYIHIYCRQELWLQSSLWQSGKPWGIRHSFGCCPARRRHFKRDSLDLLDTYPVFELPSKEQ